MAKPKIGMSLYSYGANLMMRKMTIKECIEHAASLGVEGIEFVDNRHIPEYPYQSVYVLQDLRKYVESFGMRVSSYSIYLNGPRGVPTEDEMVKTFLKRAAEAKVLGAKLIRAMVFEPREMGRNTPASREYVRNMTKRIAARVLPKLKEYDILWGAEIHAPWTPEFFLGLIKEINDEYFGLVPDFSVWQKKSAIISGAEAPIELFKECMPYTIHIHAKAHTFNEEGEEPTIPYKDLITIVKNSNFDGYISAEYEGWAIGDFTDSRITAKKHIDLIKKYL